MTAPLRLAGLISGGGRTLMNLADRVDAGALAARIDLVISSRADVPGVARSRERGFDVRVAARRDFASEEAMHEQITAWLREKPIDLVCLCGYLRWLQIDESFKDRIINIHPSLLPKFGGHGMHGLNVHRAVIEAGETITGCTVHFVDDEYDHGPVILQRVCPVKPNDDEHSLAERVFREECEAYPAAIQLFAHDRVRLRNGRVNILPMSAAR